MGNMSSTLPPSHFNEAFLSWFREQTEAAWSKYPIITLDDYLNNETTSFCTLIHRLLIG
jgi:hypothetical protein